MSSKFLLSRVANAKQILASFNWVTVWPDVVLMLCTVISACAAKRWPGRSGIDKRRFVELLVSDSPADFHSAWISIPALINRGHLPESATPYGAPGNTSRIYCDHEIDLTYEQARREYPLVSTEHLKSCSYAFLIYDWLRCGYAHEYKPGEFISHMPATEREARISYIGRLETDGRITRSVTIHMEYLFEVAEYHAGRADTSPAPKPTTWWINSM
jgi:hypothetical protein